MTIAATPMLWSSRPRAPDRIPLSGGRYRRAAEKQTTLATTPTAIMPMPVLRAMKGVSPRPIAQPADQPTNRDTTSTAINRRRTADGWRPDAESCIPQAAALSAAARGTSCSNCR